ncbi:daptide-type RiPP biosynthesis methyltransferase [Streptomyces sp. NBC_00091]|uniref:daptide-type RiPP biosynthesis methyltransferase n=1 Tax=Streptomyces sp. NBC_00091 TaxID=2975648 RepID=UPI00225B7C01|nr:daptide-type RiPP biosynthesis methyltransferase [Streptomyces sp. NBC_00091]MCX5376689.1 class I SAM-dependent methyltransferase [Streptomyces sp. NBC_00091]
MTTTLTTTPMSEAGHRLPTPADVPGRAGELLASLGERAVLCDLYDAVGASVYHDLAGTGTHEVRELLALVRRIPGPVLDLAAGSGRLTLPLLALGREVTALELSPYMLELLDRRLADAPPALRGRCLPVRADMSDFALGRRFGAIVLGTTTISLLDAEGRQGLYRAVREHLEPGGRFLLSTVDMTATASGPAEVDMEIVTDSGRAYRLFEHWTPDAGSRTVTLFPAVTAATGPVQVCTTTIGVLPAELLEAELAAAGFSVRSRHPLPAVGERHHDVLLETEVTP